GRLSPSGGTGSALEGCVPLGGRGPASTGTINSVGPGCSVATPVCGRAHTACCTPPVWRGRPRRRSACPGDLAWSPPLLDPVPGRSAGSPNGLPDRLTGTALPLARDREFRWGLLSIWP